ncbi:MAG: hypothetical protein AB1422_18945, partial [bacterium]
LRMKIEGEPMLTASRLFREINGLGYAGSSRLVRLYVGEIRVKVCFEVWDTRVVGNTTYANLILV